MTSPAGSTRRIEAQIPAQATAATPQATMIGEVTLPGNTLEVTLIANVAVALNGSAYRTFTLQNRGQSGSGSTAIATLSNQATAFPVGDEVAFTLSVTAADLKLNRGDVLALVEAVTGAGTAHGGFLLTMTQSMALNE